MSNLPLTSIAGLEPSDVVCDEGYKSLIKHRTFEPFLNSYKEEFQAASKLQRPIVASNLLDDWRQQKNGRFVKYDADSDLWNDIEDFKSRELISKALKSTLPSTSSLEDDQEADRTRQSSDTTATTQDSSNSNEAKTSFESLPSMQKIVSRRKSFVDIAPLVVRRVSASIRQNTRRKKHLYGRIQEEEELISLYKRSVSAEQELSDFLVLSGESGVGKTALTLSLEPLVREDNGFFVKINFEQIPTDESLFYLSVFDDFVRTISDMENKDLQQQHCQSITEVMDTLDESLMVSAVPALGRLLKVSSGANVESSNQVNDTATLRAHGTHSIARLKYTLAKVFRAIVSPSYPLVVLLDDLQYASSYDVFEDFIHEMTGGKAGFFFVATYRTDSWPKGSLEGFLQDRVSPDYFRKHHWELGSLPQYAVHELIADTLSSDFDGFETLSETLCRLTGGNALFLLETLRTFQEDDLLRYEERKNQWKCDDHLISQHPLLQVGSLRDLFIAKILDLPEAVQETLKIASTLGPNFSEYTLSKLIGQREAVSHCNVALKAGLIARNTDVDLDQVWAFRHDCIHDATYGLIPDSEKNAFALQLGKNLWRKVTEEEMEKFVFVILRLIFRGGEELIKERDEQIAVASLCRLAAKKAVESAGFHKSITYLRFGINVLGPRKWRDHYDISLELSNIAVEAFYGAGQFDQVDEHVDEILDKARWFEDTVQARMIRVLTFGTTRRTKEALVDGMETLSMLGEKLPSNPTRLDALLAISKTKRLFRRQSDAAILRLPSMADPKKNAVMMMMGAVFKNAYYARPYLAILMPCRAIELTLNYGISTVSSYLFAAYAVVISRSGQNAREAYRFGRISEELAERVGIDVWKCRVAVAVHGCINIWIKPMEECLVPLKTSYLLSLGNGDLEFSILNSSLYVWNCFESLPITEIENTIHGLFDRMTFLEGEKALLGLNPFWQMCKNLIDPNRSNPVDIIGEVMTQEDLEDLRNMEDHYGYVRSIDPYRLILAYHFSDFETAETLLEGNSQMYMNVSTLGAAYFRMYDALVLLAGAKKGDWRRIRRVRRHLKIMRNWSRVCPENFLGKQYLVEAELAALQNDANTARSKYYLAIIQSRDAGLLMQEALANELAGKFYCSAGDQAKATPFLKEACRLYKIWGGVAKLQHLEEEIRHLLIG